MLHDVLMLLLIIFVILLCILVYRIYDFICDIQAMTLEEHQKSSKEYADAVAENCPEFRDDHQI